MDSDNGDEVEICRRGQAEPRRGVWATCWHVGWWRPGEWLGAPRKSQYISVMDAFLNDGRRALLLCVQTVFHSWAGGFYRSISIMRFIKISSPHLFFVPIDFPRPTPSPSSDWCFFWLSYAMWFRIILFRIFHGTALWSKKAQAARGGGNGNSYWTSSGRTQEREHTQLGVGNFFVEKDAEFKVDRIPRTPAWCLYPETKNFSTIM